MSFGLLKKNRHRGILTLKNIDTFHYSKKSPEVSHAKVTFTAFFMRVE